MPNVMIETATKTKRENEMSKPGTKIKVLNVSTKPAVGGSGHVAKPRKPRAYIWTKDSRPIPPPTTKGRREMLSAVLTHMGFMPHHVERIVKMSKFSRNAGCSCGCSPGFIIENTMVSRDIFADVDRAAN
jgi:hypothetical protein